MLAVQVLSVWQAAMAMVSTFPHPPDKIKDVVNALAEEHGEPSAASFQTISADGLSDTWESLEHHIFKSRMLTPRLLMGTAVAGG